MERKGNPLMLQKDFCNSDKTMQRWKNRQYRMLIKSKPKTYVENYLYQESEFD